MAGGELRAHDGGAFGAEAIAFVRRFQVDYAICSATAINADRGFMLFDLQEAEFSREIMQRANTRIVAADSTKFGHGGPIVVCDPSMVDKLVTDAPPPADLCTAMDAWSLEIIVADTDATGAAKGLLPDDHARRGRRRGPLPCCPRGATAADQLESTLTARKRTLAVAHSRSRQRRLMDALPSRKCGRADHWR